MVIFKQCEFSSLEASLLQIGRKMPGCAMVL